VSFLSLLIVNSSHLILPFRFESFILGLTSLNLMLPAIALYKLTISGFGETYPLPLEILYKLLHLFLVNIPYLSVRIYLWQMYEYSDTSIFLVKNVYSIFTLFRGIYPDLVKAFDQCAHAKRQRASLHNINMAELVGRTSPSNGITSNKNGKTSIPSFKRNSVEELSVSLTTFNSSHTQNGNDRDTRSPVRDERI
jgi:hypothetical protein